MFIINALLNYIGLYGKVLLETKHGYSLQSISLSLSLSLSLSVSLALSLSLTLSLSFISIGLYIVVLFNSLVTIAIHIKVELISLKIEKLVVPNFLPVVHSMSGDPVVPGGHLHTNNVPSRMHSAFLPQPTVLQSGAALSGLPMMDLS
jgi:hypothetical protein